jgi:hypothetical protein
MFRYRIRRCDGNRKAWCLVTMRSDGTEHDVAFSYVTGMTIDGLLSTPLGREACASQFPIELIPS